MVARKIFNYKLRSLLTIAVVWMLFAFWIMYNITDLELQFLKRTSLFTFSLVFGFIGFFISGALVFYLKSALKNYPLWLSLLLKLLLTFFFFIIIGFILLAIYVVFLYDGSFAYFAESFFSETLLSKSFMIFLGDMGLMTFVTIIILEITDKYGPGMFWSMLRGEYHIPKIDNRIFLFLDINASTTIAESLGHTRYFSMLKDFFSDVTIPVLANGGHIYQYVGDEVVLSWPNTEENKLRCLKFIRNTFYLIKRREQKYIRRYGVVPEFKIGVHAGEVTAGFIGVVKRELIYSGDTLNTTARIRSMCNELGHSFILSEDFMQRFAQPASYYINEIGKMEIKGRSEAIKLFALTFD